MSDTPQAATPRTDAEIADDKKRGVCSDPSWVQLACALETELASAQAENAEKLGLHPATVSTRLQVPGCPLPLPPHIVRGHKRIVRLALFPDLEKFLTAEKKPARS